MTEAWRRPRNESEASQPPFPTNHLAEAPEGAASRAEIYAGKISLALMRGQWSLAKDMVDAAEAEVRQHDREQAELRRKRLAAYQRDPVEYQQRRWDEIRGMHLGETQIPQRLVNTLARWNVITVGDACDGLPRFMSDVGPKRLAAIEAEIHRLDEELRLEIEQLKGGGR